MRWLRLKFLQGSRQQRGRLREWVRQHPRVARVLERGGCLNIDETTLARGIAVGLFIGLTPTVGIQTFLMLMGSLVFRANFPAAIIVSFISNPVTMAPLYYGFNRLGSLIMQVLPISPAPVVSLGDEVVRGTLAMFLGSVVIAVPVATAGYFAFLWLWRRLGLHLPIRKSAHADAVENGRDSEA